MISLEVACVDFSAPIVVDALVVIVVVVVLVVVVVVLGAVYST